MSDFICLSDTRPLGFVSYRGPEDPGAHASALVVGCGGQAARSPIPSPSAAVLGKTVVLPPVEPGVFNFKLTLSHVEAGDGFELRFDIPHADTNLFQFCDPTDNPCVQGK